METVTYSLLYREDLDLGSGTKQVRLADNGLYTVNQLQLSSFMLPRTYSLTPTATTAIATVTGGLLAGMRVCRVTSKITTTFGVTQSLSSIQIGDGVVADRWGEQSTLTLNAETDQGDFLDASWPIYPAATDLSITAVGGLFDGTGAIELTVFYFYLIHRSA